MSEADIQRWKAQAAQVPLDTLTKSLSMPIATFLSEAEFLAGFTETHWEGDNRTPGMKIAVMKLGEGIAEELRSKIAAGRTLHSRTLYPDDQPKKEILERAKVLNDELSCAITFILDDGIEEPADMALTEAKHRLADDASQAAIAQALTDFASIGDEIKDRLDQLGDFDLSLLDEARSLATQLSEAPSGKQASDDVLLRNQILSLIKRDVSFIRLSARYVYRNHPEMARKVASAYLRRKRLDQKRKSKPTE